MVLLSHSSSNIALVCQICRHGPRQQDIVVNRCSAIEAEAWVRLMSRRVEAQLSRDWNFGFVSWNYIFRSTINQSRTFFAYDRKHEVPASSDVQRVEKSPDAKSEADRSAFGSVSASNTEGASTTRTQMGFTPQDFLEGAKQLCKALGGKYRDLDGKLQSSQR